MPAALIKPAERTAPNTCSSANTWADNMLEEHLRELNCACKDRTPGSLQSADNRREKRKIAAGQNRGAAASADFEKMWNSRPNPKNA